MFANNEHWVTLNWKEMLPNPSNAMPKKQGVQNRDKKEIEISCLIPLFYSKIQTSIGLSSLETTNNKH